MSYQDLAVDKFLERVLYLPDAEAEQELVLRKERGAAQVAKLQNEHQKLLPRSRKDPERIVQLGLAIAAINADSQRINEALKLVRRRMDRTTWAKAVTAIYGQEGYARCKLWMLEQEPPAKVRPQDLRALMAAAGMEQSQ